MTRLTHTCDRETTDLNQADAVVVLTMDTLVRYKTLPSTKRVIEMRRMLAAVFDRLTEQGGATAEELRLVAESLVCYVEEKKEAAAKVAKQEALRQRSMP